MKDPVPPPTITTTPIVPAKPKQSEVMTKLFEKYKQAMDEKMKDFVPPEPTDETEIDTEKNIIKNEFINVIKDEEVEEEEIIALRESFANIMKTTSILSREGKYLSTLTSETRPFLHNKNLKLHEVNTKLFDKDDKIDPSSNFLPSFPINGVFMQDNAPIKSGCTAVCGLLVTEEKIDEDNENIIKRNRVLYSANVGDSRLILSRSACSIPLTVDHTPIQLKSEIFRIYSAGGFVNKNGRVCGNLNLSRTVGDLSYKKIRNNSELVDHFYSTSNFGFFTSFLKNAEEEYGITEHHPFDHDEEWEKYIITAKPDIRVIELEEGDNHYNSLDFENFREFSDDIHEITEEKKSFAISDEFLIFACDGLWEVYTHQEAIAFVREGLKLGYSLKFINNALLNSAISSNLSEGSSDNITVIIVDLLKKRHPSYSYESPPFGLSLNYSSLYEDVKSKGTTLFKSFSEYVENDRLLKKAEEEKIANQAKIIADDGSINEEVLDILSL